MKTQNPDPTLKAIAGDAWAQSVSTEAENELQFKEFLRLLSNDIASNRRSENCAAYRYGRKIIAQHLRFTGAH
jgi:hypothetical protein